MRRGGHEYGVCELEDEAYEFMECGWHMSWMGEASAKCGKLYSSGVEGVCL
jgi:hypothetical protein